MNYKNEQWLRHQFETPGVTIKHVASICGCNEKTIRRWQKKFKIKSRSRAETAWLRQAQHHSITPLALEIIEGSLLGDGCLVTHGAPSAIFTQGGSKKHYIEWLRGLLVSHNIICRAKIHSRMGGKKPSMCHSFASLSHSSLYEVCRLWYPFGIKVIPKALVLTPTMCLHWFLGDGGLTAYHGGYKPLVKLSTYCFHKNDLERVMKQLSAFKPRLCYQQKQMDPGYGYKMILELEFLDYIGKCPHEIEQDYGYKWRWS